MTFPSIPTAGAGRVLTAVQANTTATRTFPSLSGLTKNPGDLLIAICIAYQSTVTNAAFSGWGAGFTEFHDSSTGTTMAIGMAYKFSDGTETGTFAVTQAGTITGHASFILLSISGAHPSTPPEAGSRASGTTSAADSASFNPAGWDIEDTLWAVVRGIGETSTSGSFTGLGNPPTNYTDNVQTGISQDVVGGVEGGISFRELNAASENPTAGTLDTSNSRSASVVIAVRPAPPAPPDFEGSSQPENSRRIVKNPRGLGFYYAAVDTGVGTGLWLFKSADGATWEPLQQLWDSPVSSCDILPVDTGSQFEMLMAYGSNGEDTTGFYRRLQVADANEDPTVGAQDDLPAAISAGNWQIARDRNGRLWVTAVDWTTEADKVKVYLSGTSETTLSDNPTWSTALNAITVTSSTGHPSRVQLATFGSGDLGALLLYAVYDDFTDNFYDIIGVDITAFNGTTFTLGTETLIERFTESFGPTPPLPLFSAITDSADRVHFLISPVDSGGAPSTQVAHYKSSAAASVEGGFALSSVDSNTDIESLALAVSQAGNQMVAVYKRAASSSIRYKVSPTGTVAWGSEQTIAANDHDFYSLQAESVDDEWHLLHTEDASPFAIVYAAISVPDAGIVGITEATETDTAGTITWAPKIRQVGLASEASTAQAIGERKRKAITGASEVDTAGPVPHTDSFDRADSQSLGADWTEHEFHSGGGVEAAVLQIVGNRLRVMGVAVEEEPYSGIAYYKDVVGRTDQRVSLTFRAESLPFPGVQDFGAGVFVRGTGTNQFVSFEGYSLNYDGPFVGNTSLRLQRHAGAGSVILDALAVTLQDGDVIALEVVGTRLRGYLNNVLVFQETDSTYASGRVGVLAFDMTSNFNGQAYFEFDNFEAADVSQAITERKARAIAAAVETATAQAIGERKREALVGATEADAAQQLGEAKRKTIAQASESDAAQTVTLGGGNAVAIVGAVETDTAGAIAWAPKIRQVQFAAETDSAGVVGEQKRKALVGSTESDAAQLLGERKREALVAATEASTAQALGERKREAIIAASEADTAQVLGERKRETVVAATETDQADTIALVGEASFPVTRAEETNSAGAVVWAPKVRLVGLAGETDAAHLLGRRKTAAVVAAQEVDVSQAFNEAKRKAVVGAAEAGSAQLLGKVHSRQLVVAAEADSAQTLTVTEARFIAVGLAQELDTAGLVRWSPKVRRVNAAQEASAAQQFARRHSRTLVAGVTTESARPVPHVRGARLAACEEVDQADLLQVLGGGTFQPDPQVHRKVGFEQSRLGPPEANIFDRDGTPRLGENLTGGTTRLGSRTVPGGAGFLGR